MIAPNIVLTPRRPALVADFDNTVDILVRAQAPERPLTLHQRPALNLAIVLDRSGSMSGAPLEAAKNCARFILDRLLPTDRIAVVVYDAEVSVLVPAQHVTDKEATRRAIATVRPGGSTDLHAGWLKGAEQIAGLTGGGAISRVLLLSDGCANHGLVDIDAIAKQCAELAAAGVTTSTYGLGQGFNEELMIRMATAGQGKSYYGESAEDLIGPFEEEFDLLSACCASKVALGVKAAAGAGVSVLNQYLRMGDDTYQLPDLVYGGESWALLRLTVPKALAGQGDGVTPVDLLSVSLRYQDMEGHAQAATPVAFSLPSVPAVAWHAIAEDPLVARRAQEIEAAGIQDQAQAAAGRRDWDEVKRLLGVARQNAVGNEWLGEVVQKLEVLAARADAVAFSKESRYASNSQRSRTAMLMESAMTLNESEVPTYLRRKAEQGKDGRKPG